MNDDGMMLPCMHACITWSIITNIMLHIEYTLYSTTEVSTNALARAVSK